MRRRPKGVALQLPPSHDTPVRLLRDVQERRLDPRSLSTEQRRACVAVLAVGKQTTHELAELFGVDAKTIGNDVRHLRRELGREVRSWTADDVVGSLVMTAEKAKVLALRQEDVGLMWSIERDLARLLADLGVADLKGKGSEGSGLRITVETIGQGHERARGVLSRALDPRLTGERPEEEDEEPTPRAPALPLGRRFPDEPTEPPGVQVRLRQEAEQDDDQDLAPDPED